MFLGRFGCEYVDEVSWSFSIRLSLVDSLAMGLHVAISNELLECLDSDLEASLRYAECFLKDLSGEDLNGDYELLIMASSSS